jgi:hypothetical protein
LVHLSAGRQSVRHQAAEALLAVLAVLAVLVLVPVAPLVALQETAASSMRTAARTPSLQPNQPQARCRRSSTS